MARIVKFVMNMLITAYIMDSYRGLIGINMIPRTREPGWQEQSRNRDQSVGGKQNVIAVVDLSSTTIAD